MTTGTRRRAPKQAAEVRRETIVEAAIRVFARTAYRAAGTAEIAQEAGIAEPTIYRHFDSKRELYLAALKRCCTIVLDAFTRIAAEMPDALEALDAMGGWYEAAMQTDPAYLRLRLRALSESDDVEVHQSLHTSYTAIIGVITEVIRRGQAQGVLNAAIPAEGAAWLFTALGHMMDLARMIGGPEAEYARGCEEMSQVAKLALLARPE